MANSVGSTLGAGVYLLIGTVAKTLAGPAVVVSFLVAAVASFLAGICYAEFSARVPKAGSAYIYSYVSVGEFWAFVIGWNMILENIIGAAASGKAWSQFVDSIFNDTIRMTLEEKVGIREGTGWFDSYPDVLALGFIIVVTILSCIGVKISLRINMIFTVINLVVICCIVSVGLVYARFENWTNSPGGFFPFGFRGTMAGAATCFYSFVGFDTIATSGEESTNPTRHVPIAIIITLSLCLLAYLSVSSVLTLLVPWNTLAMTAALPKAFAQRGIVGAEIAIGIGGVCGLTAATLAVLYPLPRSIYSMAQDGLMFHWLGKIWKKTDIPVVAMCISGVLVAVSALLLDLDSLIEMMSLGTLMAYTMVAISVLILRYQKETVGLHANNSTDHFPDNVLNNERTTESLNAENSSRPASVTTILSTNASSTSKQARLSSNESEKASLGEDTGLLKVAEPGSKVRYVPTKTTTIVKKIKPRFEADDSEAEEDAFQSKTPTTSNNATTTEAASEASVVEEYRAKVRQEQEEQRLKQEMREESSKHISQPLSIKLTRGKYEPMDSSMTSLSTNISPEEPTFK
ncbi:hypothetical protein HELRODRAFT_163387 [Helobdella robusta]|uniref:Cationic amino acid transporter C-terminal domain-containing protein n=1 Tax=Helobdella robusta TaxID=6412 RepID=T1ETZ7_HELRO|nr:hypothetical protein HELRODRAFT_163387 [Helobdella robusta]ESN96334.1 hypothetical protein HELRODRAFT_163387 [Helobdella robusta]